MDAGRKCETHMVRRLWNNTFKEGGEIVKRMREPKRKEKNVVEKFRKWFTEQLTVTEQRDLYDIMAMLRGPDDEGSDNISKRILFKSNLTMRVRHLLGVIARGGDSRAFSRTFMPLSTDSPFPLFDEIMELTIQINNVHYRDHARAMLQALLNIGIIKRGRGRPKKR